MRNPFTREKLANNYFWHRAAPTLLGGAAGAGTGALVDEDNRLRGAAIGGAAGGLLGYGVGDDLARSAKSHDDFMASIDEMRRTSKSRIDDWGRDFNKRRNAGPDVQDSKTKFDDLFDDIRARSGFTGAANVEAAAQPSGVTKATDAAIADFAAKQKKKRMDMAPPIKGLVPRQGLPPPDPKKLAHVLGFFERFHA